MLLGFDSDDGALQAGGLIGSIIGSILLLLIGDLRIPPGNRLGKLKGDRANTHSIGINDQWRICFRWTAAGPDDVEIVDYH